MTLLYLVAAWAAGIFLAPPSSPAGLWLGIAAASFLLAYLARQNRGQRLALICAALFALGAARYAWATRPLTEDHIAHYVDSGYVELTGIITRDPDVRDKHVNLLIETETLRQNDTSTSVEGLILAQAPRYGDYAYGDRVTIEGQLLTPPEFDDFSYRDYLAQRDIHAMIPNAQVEVLERDQGKPWLSFMYALKNRAQRTIDRLLPSPQAPLLSGILLGVESGISDDVREAFNQTGTAHVIAISGANIIVVIRVLMGLLKPVLGDRRAGLVTLAGIGCYTLFVGADAAVLRAAIMGSLALLAVQFGRRTYGLTSLAFAIWAMTVWNPLTLWDIGFQLSVAATAGLVIFAGDLTRALGYVLKRIFAQDTARQVTQWLTEPVVVSLAAQITTTPLILLYFGRLSIISLLANILIVPVQAYIMTLGWVAIVLGMIWPVLGEPLAWVVWIPLSYTLGIVRSLGKLGWASIDFELSTAQAWGVYGVMLTVAYVWLQHPEDRAELFNKVRQRVTAYGVIVVGIVVCILVWVMALEQPDGKLHLWFFDVGQGNAVLIQTPNGAHILIDGGPNPTRLRTAVGDVLPFWDRSLDMLFITQPKTNAINAIPTLLDRYEVRVAITNGQQSDSDLYHTLENAWQEHNIEVVEVTAGYCITTSDGVLFEVLHPQAPPESDTEPEETGLVLHVSYGSASFLVTSDLTAEAERTIIDQGWYVSSTVLSLPSHGSEAANPPEFLEAVNPQVGIAAVEAGNRTNLPAPAVVEQINGPVFRTDHHGTVEMVTDGHTLWIYPEDQ